MNLQDKKEILEKEVDNNKTLPASQKKIIKLAIKDCTTENEINVLAVILGKNLSWAFD